MPRVLVVSHFFPPHGGGGVQRVLGWVRHLPAAGWDVTVLAGAPDAFWILDPSLEERVPRATEVLRVGAATGPAVVRRSGGGVPRAPLLRWLASLVLFPDSYRAWARPAIERGRARLATGDIDVVLSTSPPETAHVVGRALTRPGGRRALPWVADFRDPWVGLHYRNPPTPFHRLAHASLERAVIARADRVLCASLTHARAIGDRARFLPNGVELDPAGEGAAPPGDGRARVVLTGTLTELPALTAFLEALATRLRSEPFWRNRLVVECAGAHGEDLPATVARLGLGDVVRLHGPLPHADARALQRVADVLLLVRNEGPGYAAMVPGKLYEYLDARRPIVAMIGASEAAELAKECGALVVGPGAGDAAVVAIAAVLDRTPNAPAPNLSVIGTLLASRSREHLARELAKILDEVRAR